MLRIVLILLCFVPRIYVLFCALMRRSNMLPNAVTLIEPNTSAPSPQRGGGGGSNHHVLRSQHQSQQPSAAPVRWDGASKLLPALSGIYPRYGATGWASNSSRELIYFFGGCDASGSPTATLQRCNVVSTEVKLMAFHKGPSARYLHATAVDTATGDTYTYGGSGTAMLLEDLWKWSASDLNWQELRSLGNGPGRRHSHQVSCSGCGTTLIVVGGSTVPPSLAYQHDAVGATVKPRDHAAQELQNLLGPRYTSTTAQSYKGGAGIPPPAEAAGVWLYKMESEAWIPIDASAQLRGRRLFSMVSISRRSHANSADNNNAGVNDIGRRSNLTGRLASRVSIHATAAAAPQLAGGRASSVASGGFLSSPKLARAPVMDTFLCTPGTRSSDVAVIIRLAGASDVTETHLPPTVDVNSELSCVPPDPSAAHPDAIASQSLQGNPDLAHLQPPPTRRAGSIFVPYSPVDDEPASVVEQLSRESLVMSFTAVVAAAIATEKRSAASSPLTSSTGGAASFHNNNNNQQLHISTSQLEGSHLPLPTPVHYTALDEVAMVRIGGTFEADLSALTQGPHATAGVARGVASRVQHIGVVNSIVVPRCTDKEQDCLDACISAHVEKQPGSSVSDDEAEDDNGDEEWGAPLRSMDVDDSVAPISRAGSIEKKVATSGLVFNALAEAVPPRAPLAAPRILGPEWVSARPIDVGVFPAVTSTSSTPDTSSEALMAHLCHLSNATVVNTAGSVFVFGGKSELDGKVSGALFLIQKKPLITEVRDHTVTKRSMMMVKPPSTGTSSPDGPSSPRRPSMRLQAILATMGSMRRRSFLTTDRNKKPKGLPEDCKESVLQRCQRRAQDEAITARRNLAQELVQTLLASGDIKTQAEARTTEAALLEQMESTGDGALAWDLHEHYYSLVEDVLRPIGMASPIVGDEGVVASETAFYLRQSVARQKSARGSKRDIGDDAVDDNLGKRGEKAVGASREGHKLEDDAAISTSGRRYHEWFHPPIVSRSEAQALERLSQPSSKTLSSARPSSARTHAAPGPGGLHQSGRVPAPLSSDTTAHRRQIRVALNREASTAPSPRPPRVTPSFSPQHGTPAAIFAQRYVSAEARMAVNASMRRPRSASLHK